MSDPESMMILVAGLSISPKFTRAVVGVVPTKLHPGSHSISFGSIIN